MLLAEVHATLGMGATAFAYAEKMANFFLNRETDDWELGFTHAIHAHAAHAAGESNAHAISHAAAEKAIAAVAEEGDRDIVQKTFERVPAP
jgi:hypothetical protein